jgi:hypothetical protein
LWTILISINTGGAVDLPEIESVVKSLHRNNVEGCEQVQQGENFAIDRAILKFKTEIFKVSLSIFLKVSIDRERYHEEEVNLCKVF